MSFADLRDRLARLEKAGELDKLLAEVDDDLPWNDFVWMLQFPAFLGAGIHFAFVASNAAEGDETPTEADLLWMLLLLAVGVAMRFGHPLLRSKVQKLRRRVRRKGVIAPAALVQASDQFGQVDEWLYGSVLLSFDPAAAQQPELLTQAAKSVFALKGVDRSTLPDDQAALAWDLYHELAPVHSLRVPASLTPGLKDCIMACVLLPPDPLLEGPPSEGPLMLALALPDELGVDAVAILPSVEGW